MKWCNKFLKSVTEDQYIVSKAFGIGYRNRTGSSLSCQGLVSAGRVLSFLVLFGGLVSLGDI